MTDALERLADFTKLLAMKTVGTDQFQASHRQRVFQHLYGGQLLAQTLFAAELTTDGRPPNSLRATFLRAGSRDLPLQLTVEREFEGRSICTRRVVCGQSAKRLLTMDLTFHTGGDGFEHQTAMPAIDPPDALPDERDVLATLWETINPQTLNSTQRRPIDVRLPAAMRDLRGEALDGPRFLWLRACAQMSDDPREHRALLAYASDYPLMLTSMLRHRMAYLAGNAVATSLDHALWFHEPFRADEWLLFVTDTPWAGNRRSLARGSFYSQQGKLVASVIQEGLLWPANLAQTVITTA